MDSLLAVFILSAICILCFSIYNLIDRYERGYLNYQERSNRQYEEILPQLIGTSSAVTACQRLQ